MSLGSGSAGIHLQAVNPCWPVGAEPRQAPGWEYSLLWQEGSAGLGAELSPARFFQGSVTPGSVCPHTLLWPEVLSLCHVPGAPGALPPCLLGRAGFGWPTLNLPLFLGHLFEPQL